MTHRAYSCMLIWLENRIFFIIGRTKLYLLYDQNFKSMYCMPDFFFLATFITFIIALHTSTCPYFYNIIFFGNRELSKFIFLFCCCCSWWCWIIWFAYINLSAYVRPYPFTKTHMRIFPCCWSELVFSHTKKAIFE